MLLQQMLPLRLQQTPLRTRERKTATPKIDPPGSRQNCLNLRNAPNCFTKHAWVRSKLHSDHDAWVAHRKLTRREIRRARRIHYSNLAEIHRANPKALWKIYNELKGKVSRSPY
eukprot:Pompholyxophrys_punicea_v1_NODE_818_length_1252_cov_3.822891.p2 type:complete len:114 gc:universal NODE_818_length_1252_cov_3.822891:584-243(-)